MAHQTADGITASGDRFELGQLPENRLLELRAQFDKFDKDRCAPNPLHCLHSGCPSRRRYPALPLLVMQGQHRMCSEHLRPPDRTENLGAACRKPSRTAAVFLGYRM